MTTRLITVGERKTVARIEPDGAVVVNGQRFDVEPLGTNLYRVSHDLRHWIVAVAGPPDDRWVGVSGQVLRVQVATSAGRRPRRRADGDDLTAPMPATVIRVSVNAGDHVTAGTVMIVLEAMKMELAIRAPRDGVVGSIHCRVGELVQAGVPLLEFT